MRRFKHLSKSDRIRIETLNNDGKTPKEIAEVVGVHISTIYRELRLGEASGLSELLQFFIFIIYLYRDFHVSASFLTLL